ncbi:MAG: heat-inducible transcriptional repressor HrcA [Eubacteriaceae bacterium]|nr:heat-inducible transcriptional repressor HrcA [Eubacteriaceae bacterium]
MPKRDRKYEILYAIIRDYITTAEPVGSRAIEKKHNLGISSATIRNEMADLEDMGFLIQPHASAGRIPSDKAYRLYVDNFLSLSSLDENLVKEAKEQIESYLGELNSAILKAAEILTKLTSYTAIASLPELSDSGIKDVRLIPIENERIFILVITKKGIVKNAEARLSFSPDPGALERVSNFVNLNLLDSQSGALITNASEKTGQISQMERKILEEILPVIGDVVGTGSQTKPNVYTDGLTEIFNYPEFQEMSKARRFIETMHKQDLLAELVMRTVDAPFGLSIGAENQASELSDYSIMTATYKLDGRPIGTLGIIGPTRMNYEKCMSALVSLTRELSGHLNASIGGKPDE